MKKKKGICLAAVIWAGVMLFAACGKKEAENLKIELEENPTTGYTWSYEMKDEDIVEVVKDAYTSEKKAVAGSGGIHVYEFSGKKEGETTITFILKRNWEGGDTADKKEFKVAVDAGGTVTRK